MIERRENPRILIDEDCTIFIRGSSFGATFFI